MGGSMVLSYVMRAAAGDVLPITAPRSIFSRDFRNGAKPAAASNTL
jgi:hypothetical protein